MHVVVTCLVTMNTRYNNNIYILHCDRLKQLHKIVMSEPTLRCRTCRYELPSATVKLCPECGTPEPHPPLCINPECRLELPSAISKFCLECGRKQQISVRVSVAHKVTADKSIIDYESTEVCVSV